MDTFKERIQIVDNGGDSPRADIVAVHGLDSNPETTWLGRTTVYTEEFGSTRLSWIRHFLPKENLRARVMTYNYESAWKHMARDKTLDDHGDDFLFELNRVRETPQERSRPLIFVGHSFGGLVVKQAVVNARRSDENDWARNRNTAEWARGFVFLGTPHIGSSYANWAEWWTSMYAWGGASSKLIKTLRPDSKESRDMHMRFIQDFNKPGWVTCFYETIFQWYWIIQGWQVVTKDSACIPKAENLPLEANHQNMQRYESREDANYGRVLTVIRRKIEHATAKSSTQIDHDSARSQASDADVLPASLPEPYYFHGREGFLPLIHGLLDPSKAIDSGVTRFCVLHGMGGTGKTTLAKKYMHEYKPRYKHIFWIRSEEAAQRRRDYVQIESAFNDSFDPTQQNQRRNIEIARARLSRHKEPWLLIFDNVVQYDDIKDYIPTGTSGSVMITTQNKYASMSLNSRPIEVACLDKDEGAALLNYYLERGTHAVDDADNDTADARKISNLVGGLPLAITLIAGYVYKTKCSLSKFLTLFGSNPRRLKQWADHNDFTPEKSLDVVFDMALQVIGVDDSGVDARAFLDCLAFMDPDKIQETMVFNANEPTVRELLNLQREDDSSSQREMLELQCDQLKIRLTPLHLVGTLPNGLNVHRMVQRRLLLQLNSSSEAFGTAFQRALAIIRAAVPKQESVTSSPTNNDWPIYEQFLPHVMSLQKAFEEFALGYDSLQHRCGLEFAELLSDVGNYMYERYLVQDALVVLRTGEKICEKVLADDSMNAVKLQILYLQASIELNHGSDLRAVAMKKKQNISRLREQRLKVATEKREPARHVCSMQYATALNNLACANMHCDDFELAATLLERSERIKQKWYRKYPELSPLIHALAESKKNLALVYVSRGDAEAAIEASREAMEMMLGWPNAGPKSKAGQFFKFMHACVLFNAGRVTESLRLNKEILQAREEVLGDAHDHTIDSHYTVGMIALREGDISTAETHLKRALELRSGYYITRLPRILHCLALVYDATGATDKAAEKRAEAQQLFEDPKVVSRDCPGINREAEDRLIPYEQMVNIWSGRFSGRINMAWQQQHRAGQWSS